jgi:hypothetical protein
MGKLSDAVAAIPVSGRPACTFGTWYATLDKADQADVDEVLASDAFGTAIATGIEKVHATKLGADTVRRHRNGRCSCPR